MQPDIQPSRSQSPLWRSQNIGVDLAHSLHRQLDELLQQRRLRHLLLFREGAELRFRLWRDASSDEV
jgi:hypothetical protein